MKTLKIHTYLLWGILLLLAACTTDHESDFPEERGNNLLCLTLTTNADSRTQIPDKDGTEAESFIKSADIYLVNSTHTDVIGPMPIIVINSYGATEIPDGMTGEYYMYVVANPTRTYSTESYDKFIGEYTIPNPSSVWEPYHFLMVNTTNDIVIDTNDNNGGVKITIPGNADVYATVNVERLAVKVEVKTDLITGENKTANIKLIGQPVKGIDDASTTTITDVVVEGSTLINCISSYNLIQQWSNGTNIVTMLDKPQDYSDVLLVTPSSTEGFTNYYNKPENSDTEWNWTSAGTPMYCLENNPPKYSDELPDTKAKGLPTGILLKVKVSLGDDVVSDTFYRFGNRLYTSMQALRLDYPEDVVSSDNPGIKEYKDGYMYYTVYLKDDRYTMPETDKYYFAVFRNSWNTISIKGISNFGKDEPGDEYDPEDPIDEEKEGINIEVRANFWTIIKTNHILK